MAEERSPYDEEQDMSEEIEGLIIQILALALVSSSDIISSDYTIGDLEDILDYFKSKSSEVIPILSSYVPKAASLGVERAKEDLKLPDTLAIDLSSTYFLGLADEVFNTNFNYILDNLREALQEIEYQKNIRDWSTKEYIKDVKKMLGLTRHQVSQTISYRETLKAQTKPKLSSEQINTLVQKRIDKLLNWRLNLISTRLSVSLIEASKLASWKQLEDSGQISLNTYGKQWVSVIDDTTTRVCINTHMEIASLHSLFSNGVFSPPATNPIHPCRSSMRLVRL